MKHCKDSHKCEWGDSFKENVCAYAENMEEWELCPKILENWETYIEHIDIALKRHEIPKDCLSCAQSFSADDDNGNMILLCFKNNNYIQVPEDGSCNEWKD